MNAQIRWSSRLSKAFSDHGKKAQRWVGGGVVDKMPAPSRYRWRGSFQLPSNIALFHPGSPDRAISALAEDVVARLALGSVVIPTASQLFHPLQIHLIHKRYLTIFVRLRSG